MIWSCTSADPDLIPAAAALEAPLFARPLSYRHRSLAPHFIVFEIIVQPDEGNDLATLSLRPGDAQASDI